MLYSSYLNNSQIVDGGFSCAPITKDVADKSVWVIEKFGYDSYVVQSNEELSMWMYINDNPVGRVIEGCNSVSIIILFVAFIIAFSSGFIPTLVYIVLGSALIYVVNIIRVGFIGVALYEFPEYERFLHEILFPAIIYGLVLLLWVVWVRKFSKVRHG